MILLGIGMFFSYSSFGTVADIDCDNISQPVQQLIDNIPEDSIINISGICHETIEIQKDRISLSGKSGASFILSPQTDIGISITGRQIVIKNIKISGGARGIVLYRAGSARIVNTDISHSGSIGIEITDSSYARILQSTISNSKRNGIVVRLSSSADIHENTITGNKNDGIVLDGSSADIDGNTISDNNDYGIFLHANSRIRLGGDNTSGKSNIFSNNLTGGIRCDSNSTIEIRIAQQFSNNKDYELSESCVLTTETSD